MTTPTEPARGPPAPSTTMLERREPEALTLAEHEEILGRLRRVGLLTSLGAGTVGGIVGVMAPPVAAVGFVAMVFVAGRLLRRARLMPYQAVIAEYGIDAAGEERLRAAWKQARRRRDRARGVAGLAAATHEALQRPL